MNVVRVWWVTGRLAWWKVGVVQRRCVKLRNIVITDLILPHLYWMAVRCIQLVMSVLPKLVVLLFV